MTDRYITDNTSLKQFPPSSLKTISSKHNVVMSYETKFNFSNQNVMTVPNLYSRNGRYSTDGHFETYPDSWNKNTHQKYGDQI